GCARACAEHKPAPDPLRRYGADDTRRDVAVRVRRHGARRRGQAEGDDQHRQRDELRRRYPHRVIPFRFGAPYHLATYIATLCTHAYLKSTGRFSLQGQIVRHRCTKTVPRLALLDANALLMPFQFQVHLDAELRRVLGDVDVAVPTPVLGELALLADHDRDARAA